MRPELRYTLVGFLAIGSISSCGGAEVSNRTFCDAALELESADPADVDFADPASVADLFDRIAADLRDLVGDAPSELRNDLRTLAEGTDAAADAYGSFAEQGLTRRPTLEDFDELAGTVAGFDAASSNLDEYVRTTCLAPPTTGSTAVAGSVSTTTTSESGAGDDGGTTSTAPGSPDDDPPESDEDLNPVFG